MVFLWVGELFGNFSYFCFMDKDEIKRLIRYAVWYIAAVWLLFRILGVVGSTLLEYLFF